MAQNLHNKHWGHMPNTKPTATVCWRLPADMIEELGPAGVRQMLERWHRRRRPLEPRGERRALVNRCYKVSQPMVDALGREAARLTEETQSDWSIARVVREIWRTAPSP